MICPKCGNCGYDLKRKGPHIGAYCHKCGQLLKWVPKNSLIDYTVTNNIEIYQTIEDTDKENVEDNDEVLW